MSYTKTEWVSDTQLTLERLNNLETQYPSFLVDFLAHNHDSDYYSKSYMESTYWWSGNTSGSDADVIYHSSGNLHAADFGGLGVEAGVIIGWGGTIEDIPEGWHLCDGDGGTRDLVGRAILSAGGTYAVGLTGGSATFSPQGSLNIAAHELTVDEIPSHRHGFTDTYYDVTIRASGPYGYCSLTTSSFTTGAAGEGEAHGHPGTSLSPTPVDSMPPWIAIPFIQKV